MKIKSKIESIGPIPSVSAIITTYRTPESLLLRSISSLQAQTLRALEIILVVDDSEIASTLSPALLDSLCTDARIRVVCEGRLGRGRALNLAVAQAAAPLIAIQDADDESHPERLHFQHLFMSRRQDAFLVGTACMVTSRSDSVADWVVKPQENDLCGKKVGKRIFARNCITHTSVMYRRDDLLKLGGYSTTRRAQFDYEMYLRACAAGLSLWELDLPLVLKRFHGAQFFERGLGLRRITDSWLLQLGHARKAGWMLGTLFSVYGTMRFFVRCLLYLSKNPILFNKSR